MDKKVNTTKLSLTQPPRNEENTLIEAEKYGIIYGKNTLAIIVFM
jgi:hypothetical protein